MESWLYHYGLVVKSINLLLLDFILKEDVLVEIVARSIHRNNSLHKLHCSAAAIQILNVKANCNSS